jgi:hypothetical protein
MVRVLHCVVVMIGIGSSVALADKGGPAGGTMRIEGKIAMIDAERSILTVTWTAKSGAAMTTDCKIEAATKFTINIGPTQQELKDGLKSEGVKVGSAVMVVLNKDKKVAEVILSARKTIT